MKSLIAGVLSTLVISTAVLASQPEKITICHASGLSGTTKFETLTIPENAVYGKNGESGHFNENGTTKAGHEEDYLGACRTASPSPSVSASPKSSPSASPSVSPSASPSVSPSVNPSPSDNDDDDKEETKITNFSDEHPELGKPSKSGK